jgi:hypothetical protein
MWSLPRSLAKTLRSFFGRTRTPGTADGSHPEGAVLAVRLLQDERVRRELGLDSAQVTRLVQTTRDVRSRSRDAFRKVRARPQQERRAAARGLMRDVSVGVLKALEKGAVLTAVQHERLWQLVWQNCGPAALVEPAVRQALRLTEGQAKQIEEIRARILGHLRGAGQGEEDEQEPAENRARVRRQALDEALVLLTAEQRSRWEELKGPPAAYPLDAAAAPPADELG